MAILSLITAHPYIFIFFGLIVGGESVLVPALFLAVTSKLNVLGVLGISLVATMISDIAWYAIGYYLTHERVARILGPKREQFLEKLSSFFQRRSFTILYVSKFIYGTRIVAQVLCGVYKLNFFKYLAVNTAGILSLNILLLILATASKATVAGVERQSAQFFIAMAILAVLVTGSHHVIKKYVYPRWFQ